MRVAEPLVDIIALCAISIFFIGFVPFELFYAGPATGGDTGSHFWPLVSLVEHGLPEGRVRMWNPGNLGGEPHLVHYFPLPYFLMAALHLVWPLGACFNIGSLLPLLLLPLSVYLGSRLIGWKFPAPIMAAAASLSFLYNESFVMWGGNTLSTMAGQFAHVYAFDFVFLAIGALAYEVRKEKFPFASSILFASVNLSHAYLMVGLPLIMLSALLFFPWRTFKRRFVIIFLSGVFSVLLSLWFLIPMVQNAPWTTAYFFFWESKDLLAEIVPSIFFPVLVCLILSAPLTYYLSVPGERNRISKLSFFWIFPSVGYIIYYWLFPIVGLVDARAFPQAMLFICILGGLLTGHLLRKERLIAFLSVIPVVSLSIYWADKHAINFPGWIKWNYSSWASKPAYPDLEKLYEHIRGDFSMPRVIYEHNVINNRAGTERVFEMLPYFTGRATLESVYNQASILAPAAFLIQAEVSKTPSCPFAQYDCAPYNLDGVKDRLKLLGVGELILTTEELISQARETRYLVENGTFGQWTLFKTDEVPTLVDVFSAPPLFNYDIHWSGKYTRRGNSHELAQGENRAQVDQSNWKELFYYWLKEFWPESRFIIVDQGEHSPYLEALKTDKPTEALKAWGGNPGCKPTVVVEFNRILLKTPCPGYAHYLKFAYHSAWRTDTKDPLFLVSPGFIALVPSKNEVLLTFGETLTWRASGMISILGLFLLVGCAIWYRPRFRVSL